MVQQRKNGMDASMRGDLYGSAALVVIGVALLVLAAAKQSAVAA
jgi:hypothetical protein